ncbi:DNA-directed RNA polymerase III subunit RPC4 [Pleodorina starrii]|uniref:DNA-directed RNA polymerase III subunit RPC4 n=1 Tax=Pleodorina starrii TaxID=330485 RepID=A0A9W6F3G3_9CHLO|nr:DNA-directed RNA polymerase III subunit RPC4 [Pleodorina starrii]GLC55032.1 DNA-directed RNA polymerase III subunit RPC4 [Pleodorina starrii]
MLGLTSAGPLRLSDSCSRRCGARLLAPIAPSWSRPGALLLPHTTRPDVCLHAKRGRPRKDESAQPPPAPAQEGGEDADGADGEKPRRGRRSRKEKEKEEARDLLESQQINMEVLEEFKARAAAEEEAKRAAMGDSSEDDPRRLNFHRSLLAASQRGLTGECARIVDSMADAGLPPGPRAIHVWAYSYIQIGDGPGAKRIAEAGREAYGVSWIPETYVALMHGALSATPGGPDLMTALSLWVAQQDAGANPQLGFTFLTKELFRLRYSALAMQVVSEGYAAGLQPDEKLAALVIEQLCKQGLMEEARAEMQRLLDAGQLVGPEHYDTIVRLEAARGDLAAARGMLQAYYEDPRFSPPRASSYTALLKGFVSALRPPDGGPPPDRSPEDDDPSSGAGAGSGGGGGGGGLALGPDQLDALLNALREEMVARGLRPGREAYAAMVEAFAVVGDLDSALATYETMTRAKGSPALMRKKYLGRFVVSLLTADRPIDALRLLRDCSTTPSYADARSCVTLPAASSAPLPPGTLLSAGGVEVQGGGDGRSALTVWLPGHFEVMRQRKGQRASVLAFMRDADLSSRREVDGVVLGMGGAVVTEEGLFVPPPKMSMAELRVELTASGTEAEAVARAGRKELQKMVKDRRERLPSGILEMQAQLEGMVAAREEEERAAAEAEGEEEQGEEEEFDDDEPDLDTLDVNIASIIADEGTFEGGDSLEDSATFRAAAGGRVMLTDEAVEEAGEVEEEDEDLEEEEEEDEEDMEEDFNEDMPAAAAGRRRRGRGRGRGGDDDDALYDDDDDALLGLDEDGGAPPLGDGLGPSGGVGPDDLDWEVERGRVEVEDDALILDQLMAMSVMDSARYNGSAGMAVAMRMLELWAAVGGSPTAADLMTLYEGAVLEEHSRCCADLAEQLPSLLAAGEVGREQLSEMLLTLATVCLKPGSSDGEAADRVVTVLEDSGMQVPPDVYAGLEAALAGRPRMRDSVMGVAGGRVEADLTGSGLESSVAIGEEDQEEEVAGGGVLAGVLGSGDEPEAAEGEEEEGEEGVEEGEEEEGEEEEGDLELFGEYEEDPGQLEEERLELERLFQQDGEEDDAWLDELDEPAADVDEVRAAAEAEASAVRQAELVATTLESVRARSPFAAAVLEHRLAAMQLADAQMAAAEAADEAAEPAALPAGGSDVVPYGAVAGLDEAEATAEEVAAAEAAAAMLGGGRAAEGDEERQGELSGLAAEAEWDAAAVLELPPVVLAEAMAATEAEAAEAGVLSEEDRALLRRLTAKTQLLAELSALNTMAAQQHPGGAAAAEAELAEALRRISIAEAEGATATTILAAAAAAAGETPESLAAAAADEEGVDAVGLELEEEGEEEGELLRSEHLDPGVDDGALEGPAARLLETIMEEAEAVLAAEEAERRAREEEEGGEGEGAEEEGDGFEGLDVGAEEVRLQSEVLQRMVAAAEAQGPELTEEQQELYDMLEAGDLASLESKLGPDVMTWLAADLQRAAAEQGGDVDGLQEEEEDTAASASAAEEGEEEGEEVDVEFAPGWRLNDRFMAAFGATLRDRAAAGEAEGIRDESPEVAAVDALLALANGYRPEGFEEGLGVEEEGGEGEGGEEEEEGEVVLSEVQREAAEALAALAAAAGGPGEAAARAAAERALAEAMAVQSERYEEAEAEGEEARVLVRARRGGEEGEYEEGGEEEEEEGFEVPAAVPPEVAAEALRRLHAEKPGVGPVFVAKVEAEVAEAGAVAVAEPEEEEEEEEPPARGRGAARGRGGGGSGRARKSSGR